MEKANDGRLTVGDLRKAIEGVPDQAALSVYCEDDSPAMVTEIHTIRKMDGIVVQFDWATP
jgi:hypothetical protein